MPSSGKSASILWSNSMLAAELCAAGAFDQATHCLSRQIGACNFNTLKPNMLLLYQSSHLYMPIISKTSLALPVRRENDAARPELPLKMAVCVEKLKLVYWTILCIYLYMNVFCHNCVFLMYLGVWETI